MPEQSVPEQIVPGEEAKLLQQLADVEALPDDGDDRPGEYYEALEDLAVFYVRAERLDTARPYWERLWEAHPASCWTKASFEQFAYDWFYFDGQTSDAEGW